MTFLFASTNQGKIKEIKTLLFPYGIEVKSLFDIDYCKPIEETGKTFQENAIIKAKTLAEKTHLPVIADDSGLVVLALNGEPGIYSARYADGQGDEANNQKLLEKLAGVSNRQAYFISVIALAFPNGKITTYEGIVQGLITTEPKGNHGFGYDPLFFLPYMNKTMAECTNQEKNTISHRAIAMQKLIGDLNEMFNHE